MIPRHLYLFALPFLMSCNTPNTRGDIKNAADTAISETAPEVIFPALVPGEVELDEADFGEVVELAGTSHPVEQIFKVQETNLLVKADTLIIKNRNGNNFFMAYSLPELSYLGSFGRAGKGPGELNHPSIIAGNIEDFLFSFFDINGKVYHVNKFFEIVDSEIAFDTKRQLYDPNKICAASEDVYYYVGVAPVAKEIYKYSAKDSTPETSIKKLSVKGFKGWASYTGYLGANFGKDRLVFAYKYFKKIVFMDLSGNVERTITFNTETKTEKQSNVATLGPSSVTYYWGLSAQKDYVYLLYSGRTPLEVMDEKKNSTYYIYVEQFDWNGNPIRKFKLDHWGYFCVDDKEENIYLASTDDENPIYSYKLPKHQEIK